MKYLQDLDSIKAKCFKESLNAKEVPELNMNGLRSPRASDIKSNYGSSLGGCCSRAAWAVDFRNLIVAA